jgi:hypothetical protein
MKGINDRKKRKEINEASLGKKSITEWEEK